MMRRRSFLSLSKSSKVRLFVTDSCSIISLIISVSDNFSKSISRSSFLSNLGNNAMKSLDKFKNTYFDKFFLVRG